MAPNAGVRLIILSGVCLAAAAVYAFPSMRKRFSTNVNLMMTMLLGGLWHGASWNFVLWGGLTGLGLIAYKDGVKSALGQLLPLAPRRWCLCSPFISSR